MNTFEEANRLVDTYIGDIDALNQAIEIPADNTLRSVDGREFKITGWHPSVSVDSFVTVNIDVQVYGAKKKEVPA